MYFWLWRNTNTPKASIEASGQGGRRVLCKKIEEVTAVNRPLPRACFLFARYVNQWERKITSSGCENVSWSHIICAFKTRNILIQRPLGQETSHVPLNQQRQWNHKQLNNKKQTKMVKTYPRQKPSRTTRKGRPEQSIWHLQFILTGILTEFSDVFDNSLEKSIEKGWLLENLNLFVEWTKAIWRSTNNCLWTLFPCSSRTKATRGMVMDPRSEWIEVCISRILSLRYF